MKVSYLRMYDNDILVRDMMPAKKNGAYGMYDELNDVFYGNAGSGSFTHGGEFSRENSVAIGFDGAKCETPSPAYGYTAIEAGGQRTLRAPKYAYFNNTLMTCAGWELYDSASGYDTPVATGTENRYAYTHPDPARPMKFVWKWEPAGAVEGKTTVAAGEWDDPDTWSPSGVPGIDDDVVLLHSVHCSGDVAAKSITALAGTLRFHASTSDTVANATPDAPGDGSFTFRVAGDVEIVKTGVSLHGGRTTPVITNLVLSVGGDFTLFGQSSLCVAAAAAGEGVCTDVTNLCNTATTLAVGGDFTVGAGARLYPVCDQKAGSPVHFRCANFELGSDALVCAQERGWHMLTSGGTSYAPGQGNKASAIGGGYGGRGSQANATYGKTYGYKYAPFLPGSNSGSDSNWPNGYGGTSGYTRGGGVFWLTTPGQALIDGQINAYALTVGWQAASGGGVWINAGSFDFGSNARIDVHGGDKGSSTPKVAGGGGRISLSKGVTEEQLAALARGEEPEGLIYADTITLVACEARGGSSTGASTPAEAGTMTYVSEGATVRQVSVHGSPVAAVPVVPAYGDYTESTGTELHFSAGRYADDPDDATWRYLCLGYVISNETAEVASGETLEASYTLGNDPIVFTWLWDEREYLNYLTITGPGTVSVDGEVHAASTNIYKRVSAANVYTAVPADGAEFLYWSGDVPAALRHQTTITLPAEGQWHPKAIFRTVSAASPCVWKDNATGDFYDPANWVDGAVPARDGAALIGSGEARLPNCFEIGSLTVTGGLVRAAIQDKPADGCSSNVVVIAGDLMLTDAAKLRLGVTDGSSQLYNTLEVGGNLVLRGEANLTVTAGRRSDALGYTWATGCGFVNVGGNFRIEDAAVFTPNCAGYNGGSVRTTVAGAFSVATNATVDANGRGNGVYGSLGWTEGLGDQGHRGAAHGGRATDNVGGVHSPASSVYDFLYAPMKPGQQNRETAVEFLTRGGGCVRISASSMKIEGTVTADGQSCKGGNTSGGSIWLASSGALSVGPSAVLSAKGAYDAGLYAGGGASGGGRISLCKYLKPAQLEALTSSPNALPAKVRDVTDAFLVGHESFTNAVAPGSAALDFPACWGTFKVLDGAPIGFMMLVR